MEQSDHVEFIKGKMPRKMGMQTTLFIPPEVTSICAPPQSKLGTAKLLEKADIFSHCVTAIEMISLWITRAES